MQNFEKTDEEFFEELYEEWRNSEEAILSRAETLPILKLMNNERKTAFIAGCECVIAGIIKRLESLPNATESR